MRVSLFISPCLFTLVEFKRLICLIFSTFCEGWYLCNDVHTEHGGRIQQGQGQSHEGKYKYNIEVYNKYLVVLCNPSVLLFFIRTELTVPLRMDPL